MKRLYLLVALILYTSACIGQEDIVPEIRRNVDSILQKIELEKDHEKRFDLILTIYDTRVEGYPLLILETFRKLLVIAKRDKDIISESNAYSFAGQGYRLSANYIKALDYHHKAIALAEESGNISVLAWAQNQIGHIYKDREENGKAIALYTASKQNATRGKVKYIEAWAMMNLAAVYLAANQPDSSLFYGNLSYEKLIDQKGFFTQAPYIFSNMAGAYSKKGDNVKALEYSHKAISLANKNRSPRYKGIAYTAFAQHFQRINQLDSCVFYAKNAIESVNNSLFGYMAIKPARLLMDLYENTNADSTIKYLKIYRAANDSLNNTRANQQLQLMTFEEDQRIRDLADAKTAYQNKIRTNLMLAGLAIFLVVAIILYRNNRQKHKANKVLEATLISLKSTQSQLIQSEKMASLGELTAGIAHEIQNPLNFVNNFSDVNTELIDEMKEEFRKGNTSEAVQLAEDIKQNNEKISFHGKRADSIVKGMLQHSRNSSGQKELTDINNLADECLRLSYHGFRAKDHSFNSKTETHFEEGLPQIQVAPQDIGRVLLNLITNSFYSVALKRKEAGEGYEPMIEVSTKNLGNAIEIRVWDNGNGVPQKVLDKIFQPFFTTKPTGEGTGLGLSMSYEIITKGHGGQLVVDTKEGEYAEFSITLPFKH
ncbi:MAG TPA: ATP-binding protein [Chitinophagaceae bacterium]|nr:ATP-binding protein [Chitinophagaceae bacterium]